MSEVIQFLKRFNRKERFLLLCTALGYSEHEFRLGKDFREELSGLLRTPVPCDAYVAMDYHLDWLHMALYLATDPPYLSTGAPPKRVYKNDGNVRGTQEDIDLLIAFDASETTHIVLCEAKGDTAWSERQLSSKVERLKGIFLDGSHPASNLVTPHFVALSPSKSKSALMKPDRKEWPDWMKKKDDGNPHWIRLNLPSELFKVTRCSQSGKNAANGSYLRLDQVRQ